MPGNRLIFLPLLKAVKTIFQKKCLSLKKGQVDKKSKAPHIKYMRKLLEKMTQKSKEAFQEAVLEAQKNQNPSIEPIHFILEILRQKEALASQIVELSPLSRAELIKDLEQEVRHLPKVSGSSSPPYPSNELIRLLSDSEKEAEKQGDIYISTEHFVLAFLSSSQRVAKKIAERQNWDRQAFLTAIKKLKGGKKVQSAHPEDQINVLDKYTRDLTQLAEQGQLDPVIGRDSEIRRLIQVLSRRTKNNPVLIGEPGVGKTAIAEGLALRILKKDVPEALFGKKVLALDLAVMIAGTKYRGEFENRMKALISELKASEGRIFLFIDELHTLVGAGKTDGAMDAGQMLKPALARGELRAIGATTLDEYRKFIEKDKALERRFQIVFVKEPGVADSLTILRGLKEKYEAHHGVRIKDSALLSAVKLSHRYISDRFLPDKAIDLIDEAASRLNIEIHSVPAVIDENQRKIIHLQVEKKALLKEKGPAEKKRCLEIEKILKDLKEQTKTLKTQLEKEKGSILKLRSLKRETELIKQDIERSEREGALDKAAELKYGRLPQIKKELSALEEKARDNSSHSLLKEEVGPEEIAEVVSQWTGIPLKKVLQKEVEKLLSMEKLLRKRVLGQDQALSLVSDSIRRARAELSDPESPLGSFIFLGPTGVGKTETAKALAEFLFDTEKALIRLDMSEYMEKHSVSRLVGAPPGYVGFEEGGQLTERVRRQPYSIILLDEIEKAHPDVFNILLQVLDDGRLTDGQGRAVDFKSTALIMTSNLGSDILSDESLKEDEKQTKIMDVLKKHFRPEFLNRIDEVVIYNSLDKEQIEQIVKIHIQRAEDRLTEGGKLDLDSKALSFLSKKAFDPVYGARPVKRAIQRELLNPLAQKLLKAEISKKSKIKVTANDLRLEFKNN